MHQKHKKQIPFSPIQTHFLTYRYRYRYQISLLFSSLSCCFHHQISLFLIKENKHSVCVCDIYLFALSLEDHHIHIMDFLETVDTQILVGAAVALVAIVAAAFYIFSSNKPKGLTCFCLLLHYFFFFVDLIHCFTESSNFEFWVF